MTFTVVDWNVNGFVHQGQSGLLIGSTRIIRGRAGKGRQVNRFAAWLTERSGPTVADVGTARPR